MDLFQLKLIVNRIERFQEKDKDMNDQSWISTFDSLVLDLSLIESNYKKGLSSDVSNTAIQSVISQTFNCFLKRNESKYYQLKMKIDKPLNALQEKKVKETKELLAILKNSRLQTEGDEKPEFD